MARTHAKKATLAWLSILCAAAATAANTAAALLPHEHGGQAAAALPVPLLKAIPLPLGAVTVPPTSRLAQQRDANTDWLMGLDVNSLTCLYTAAANLTCSTKGFPYACMTGSKKPTCTPYYHQVVHIIDCCCTQHNANHRDL